MRAPSLLAATALAVASPAGAQAIRGLLLESGTDRPIELGAVTMLGERGDTLASALSDENGLFSLTAPTGGRLRVIARALGYSLGSAGPFQLEDDGVMVVQVMLEPEPIPIAGIDVGTTTIAIAEVPYLARRGFYNRMNVGVGHYITPTDLEEELPLITYTPELFYRIPGVFVSGGGRRVQMRSTRGDRCPPAVFVDGMRVTGAMDWVASLEALEAVEVYTRPVQVPLQYLWAGQGCGVILFWTKH